MESTQELLAPPGPQAIRHRRPTEAPQPLARRWIPMRSLTVHHRPRILSHLQALPAHDRYLRFGFAASAAQIARYVDLINFTQDDAFGVFNRRLDLIALAHLANLPGAREAEFGVSVLPSARGRGYGSRLFDRAMLEARNRGVDALVIHALAENTAMLRIARRAGAIVEREGGDTLARLRLPPDDLRSHLDAFFESSAAEVDFHLKAQRKFVSAMLASIGDICPANTGNARESGGPPACGPP
jgi:RimJ/RimL family protein N-acetyltransferase